MLVNDPRKDFKKVLIDEGITQEQVADKIGTSKVNISNILRAKAIVNAGYIKICEAAGYNVRLVLEPIEK